MARSWHTLIRNVQCIFQSGPWYRHAVKFSSQRETNHFALQTLDQAYIHQILINIIHLAMITLGQIAPRGSRKLYSQIQFKCYTRKKIPLSTILKWLGFFIKESEQSQRKLQIFPSTEGKMYVNLTKRKNGASLLDLI